MRLVLAGILSPGGPGPQRCFLSTVRWGELPNWRSFSPGNKVVLSAAAGRFRLQYHESAINLPSPGPSCRAGKAQAGAEGPSGPVTDRAGGHADAGWSEEATLAQTDDDCGRQAGKVTECAALLHAAALRAAGLRPAPLRTADDIIEAADLYEFNRRLPPVLRLVHTYLRDAAELCQRAAGESAREVREAALRGALRAADQAAYVYERAVMRSR
jgi:hypothetical protein